MPARTIGHFARRLRESLELGVRLVVEPDQAEGDDVEAQRRGIQERAIAADDAGLLEPPDTSQARRRRNADALRQLDIGDAAFLLQLAQDLPVDGIEVGLERHGGCFRSGDESQ